MDFNIKYIIGNNPKVATEAKKNAILKPNSSDEFSDNSAELTFNPLPNLTVKKTVTNNEYSILRASKRAAISSELPEARKAVVIANTADPNKTRKNGIVIFL